MMIHDYVQHEIWYTLPKEYCRAPQSREGEKMSFLQCIQTNFNYPAEGIPGLLDHH